MARINVDTVRNGPVVLPIQRLKLYDSTEWENFINEWVDGIKQTNGYVSVERLGGAGDMGRDSGEVLIKADLVEITQRRVSVGREG